MTLKPGTKLGPHEVLAAIGAGGMGEVYRARDTKLEREVAIKVLPEVFARDPERLARFRREAQLLASLNHENIAQIYGLFEANGIHYLAMELVPGPTLGERIKAGPVEIEEALRICVQIAAGLEAAHEKTVVHRDLKPANVKVTPQGKVKILDFGLAKAMAGDSSAEVYDSQAPTAPTEPPKGVGATIPGTVMGTAAYMSPEQARGQKADRRTDIWALGCILYELLTAKRTFPGETFTEIAAGILKGEPDWLALPAETPANIRLLLRRCLQKDLQKRFHSAADVGIQLEDALAAPAGAGQAVVAPAKGWLRIIPWGVAFLAGAIITGLAVWKLKPTPMAITQAPAHVTIALPPGDRLAAQDYPPVALSPDGSHLVYGAIHNGVQQLFARAMDSNEVKPLAGTEGSDSPFFSPDSQWVGFFAGGKLKKVSIAGGTAQTLCDSGANGGASWGTDDTIVFAPTNSSGLMRVSAAGGTPQVLTTLDRAKGEVGHRWPQFLPGGKALLFTLVTGPGWDERHTAVLRLETGERRVVLRGGNTARFVPTGHLVYYRAATLLAVPFDLARLEVTSSSPITIADGVVESASAFGAEYSFSAAGLLAYIPASPRQFERHLVWVDRKGEIEPLSAPPRPYDSVALSPDGRQIAVDIRSDTAALWIHDLARGALTRVTTEGSSQNPIWTPDGKRIAYRGTRAGFRNLFLRTVDGTGTEERLTTGENLQTPISWSPDGKWLAFRETSPTTGFDIWILQVEGERKQQAFLRTPFNEANAVFSPDSRWLAYQSDESGRNEVYVQPFPGPGGKWQISTEGGSNPRWARNGRELFYRNGNKMMAANIKTEPTFTAGKPRLLFEGQFAAGGGDVSPDGQRFLMIQAVEPEQPATQINVVLNWFEELKRKAPGK